MDNNYVEIAWKNGKVRLSDLKDDQLDDILNFVKTRYIRVDNAINVGGSEFAQGKGENQNPDRV
ncbi:hypothetical protein [Apilactobacillus timberlakei]|uniref:hypothetical protein n=1 Tax=Apilactobacillus timberlakei TaxID=2008380 RepID=UPI0011288AAA|nr:hypothetical protein [Apilactobacillus timberlakei]TPR16665.1 hypothetical protein DYZ95_07425 [Apilactobacillus timberlakei]